ncbi:hypothetical protein [Brevundimonas aurantiaca]|uniref:hypothetical protein n=1 Tax=Brevundimonas aurantiaca TaxID=74316 RepID=UPI00301B442A
MFEKKGCAFFEEAGCLRIEAQRLEQDVHRRFVIPGTRRGKRGVPSCGASCGLAQQKLPEQPQR